MNQMYTIKVVGGTSARTSIAYERLNSMTGFQNPSMLNFLNKNNTKRDVSEENESMGYTFESRSSRSKRDSWNIDRRMT